MTLMVAVRPFRGKSLAKSSIGYDHSSVYDPLGGRGWGSWS